MAKVSKVIYGGNTLIDLTADTVTAAKMLKGTTAHDKTGEQITGTCEYDANTTDATAGAAEILKDKTAYVNKNKVTGTMPNNGGVHGVIQEVNETYTIPQGYHDGSGTVVIATREQGKLLPENIREGVEILGVLGEMSGTEGAKPQAKTVVPSTDEQQILPDTAQGYNYLSQVTVAAIPYTETDNAAGGKTVTIG